MKRKLFSALLSVFALLLLMGAAAVPEQPAAALVAEEESAATEESALEPEAQTPDPQPVETPPDSTADPAPVNPVEPVEPVPTTDNMLLLDGQPTPLTLGRYYQKSTAYVALSAMAQLMDPAAQVAWDGKTMTVTTPELTLSAQVGKLYLVANERYLYVPETVLLNAAGQVAIPLRTAAKVFNASVNFDPATGVTTITRGSGVIASGESFYNAEDLYWLSRIIYRESGNQSLEGQMAVGNVVLNRVANPVFPNTVEGVLAQKNQFSSYRTGALAKTKPSTSSTIAAKLVMDGGVVEETKGALYFDSGSNSWAARNKTHIATLGGHKFYG